MGVKISELPAASSANNSDSLILNHGSETKKITLEALLESYLSGAGLVTETELDNALSGVLSESDLSDYLSESDMSGYVQYSYLSEAIGSYVSEALANYLSEADLSGYISAPDLSEALSDYVSASGLSDALNDYMTSSEVQDYLRDQNYVSDDSLSYTLSSYLSDADVSPYLSEGLAGLANLLSEGDLDAGGYVSSSSFAAALEAYLTEYGGQTIYDAISQYVNPAE